MNSGQTLANYLQESLKSGASTPPRSALVVQGGGMRGVYSMGALVALQERRLHDAFDLVIGSSAGAINAAYLLADQAEQALAVYVDHLTNKSFVNAKRVTKIVDIDYLVDDVLKVACQLDVNAVRKSRSDLQIVVTDAVTAEAVVFSAKDDRLDMYELIRATAALPGLYNRKIPLNGRRFVDGGVADGVPVRRAITAGATDIVAVITRPTSFRRMDDPFWKRRLTRLLSLPQSRAVRRILGREDRPFNDTMELLKRGPAGADERMRTVWPSDESRLIGRTTSDKALVAACAEMGKQDMLRALDEPFS